MSSIRMKKVLVGMMGLVLAFTFFSSIGYAQVPLMNYQGYLTDPGGTPIHGAVQMVFSIYDVSTGGTALWNEAQSVAVNQGVYSVNLGDINPLILPFDKPYYLGVKVGIDSEMTPRRVLTSVGYAFTANTALNLVCTGCVSQSHLSFTPGDITAVNAGTGLTGGGVSGDVTLSADTSYLQRRVTGSCTAGSSIRVINLDGTVACETDDIGIGDITAVIAGAGLSGGGTSGDVTLNVNTALIQSRVTGTCASGSSIRVINPDGTVACETDDGITVETDPQVGSNTTNYVPRWNGSALVTGMIYDNGGNIGIGTSTPVSKLDVNGDVNINLSSVYKIGGSTVLSTKITGNTFLGDGAGYNTTGNYNTFLGNRAGYSNTTGYENTFLGYGAGYSNTTGNYNTFLGDYAGYSNTTGYANTFLGNLAGRYNTTGFYNTFLGLNAGYSNTMGSYNIFLGNYAGYSNDTGSYNTFLGDWAGYFNTTGSGNVFIGYGAGYNETESDKLYIDNGATSSPLIYGDFSANSVTINGDFNVTGTKSFIQPHAKDPTKEIVYIAAEAPEAVVMYRGTAQLKEGVAVIELPEHFGVVAADNGIQVQVTPNSTDTYGLAVVEKNRERILVKELMNRKGNFTFDYLVTAVRAGFEKHEPIVANTNFRPKANEKTKDFEARYSGDDMNTKAMRAMLISNGILTQNGELNMEVVKNLGWTVKEADVAKIQEDEKVKKGTLLFLQGKRLKNDGDI